MNDKRDEVIEAAKQYATETNCLMKGHILSIRHQQDAAYCAAMADFALSREAEIRRQIAADLTVIHPPYSHGQDSGINCDICKYIEKLRGKK